MGSRDPEAYSACPYCLTEILGEESRPAMENEQDQQEREEKTELIRKLEIPVVEKKTPKPELRSEGCQHHFGYLGERQSKEKIPETCMTCASIVKCMLKKVST